MIKHNQPPKEENTLCYVGGYVCHRVEHNISQSSLSNKEDMLVFCMQPCGDEEGDEKTETWTNAIDRDGLWHMVTSPIWCSQFLKMKLDVISKFQLSKKIDEMTKR